MGRAQGEVFIFMLKVFTMKLTGSWPGSQEGAERGWSQAGLAQVRAALGDPVPRG